MKARMSIKNIIMVMAAMFLASMFFINICFATNTGKITTETARLREQPQTDAEVLELVSLGEEVEILEETNGWYKVKYKNITGYIRNDLIEAKNKEENVANNVETENTETENTQTENANTQETQTTENTNTETNASVDEEIALEKGKYKILENAKFKIIPLINAIELGEVNKDSEVEVTEVLNDWAKIKTADGKEGWVIRRRTASTGEIVVLFGTLENTDNETTNNNTSTRNETENNNTSNNTSNDNETSNNQPENTTKTMYVNSQTINVRQKADKTSQVIKQLSINTQVTVISTENGWSYVDINGTKGYIAENLLSSTKKETSRGTMTERSTTNSQTQTTTAETTATTLNKETTTTANSTTSSNTQTTNTTESNTQKTENTTSKTTTSTTGSSVVAYAQQFLGCKYVYGGTTTSGFDCSGFTQFVYKHFGINLNRTAAAQYSNGTAVTNLQAGDLVMFGKSGINHVGIYIGGNTFIHAANPSRGVTTDTLASGYYKTNYVGARRIL